jgi:hypothetical protein
VSGPSVDAARQDPPAGPTVEFQVHFRHGNRGRRRLRTGERPTPPAVAPGRVPRVARLLALAIRFDALIRQGAVQDYAELARLGGVSRARISQVMDLLNLAPEIQEGILFLPRAVSGRDPVTERELRSLLRTVDWGDQRRMRCAESRPGVTVSSAGRSAYCTRTR